MQRSCAHCHAGFEVTDEDMAFYAKIDVPAPTWCPPCREMRRMAWSNEGMLYPRTCAKCQKAIIAEFAPGNPRTVYCIDCWWGDGWDAGTYAKEVDLNRSIAQQIHELELAVPHPCVNTDRQNENSEYTHHAGHEKNCYMVFHTSFAEDCWYGYGIKNAKNCVDNHYCHKSELCYECVDVENCYGLSWCQDCHNCSSSMFLEDCRGCRDCVYCVGLRNRQYCMFNEQHTKEEYEKRLKELNTGSHRLVTQIQKNLRDFRAKRPARAVHTEMTEDSLGDHLYRARKTEQCFDCSDIEFSKYCSQLQLGTKYCYDIYQFGVQSELCVDSAQVGYNMYNVCYCFDIIEQCHNLRYCLYSHSTSDCFGCVGLKKGKFRILNTQYTEEEYKALLPKVIAKMTADGEYGEFLPPRMSPHGYNETIAQMWHPKTKEEVRKLGWTWEEGLPFTTGKETLKDLPDDIAQAEDGISRELLRCTACARNYKILPRELAFYRSRSVPLPRECFPCRRLRRHSARNPRVLREIACTTCGKPTMTTVPEGGTRPIVCEKCYLEAVY